MRARPITAAEIRQITRMLSRPAIWPMTTLPTATPISPRELMAAMSARAHPSACSIGTKKAVRPLTSVPTITASIAAAAPTANHAIAHPASDPCRRRYRAPRRRCIARFGNAATRWRQPGPVIVSGRTQRSNSSADRKPSLTAASFRVLSS